MLIERFDLIKRALVYQRLFLVSKYGCSTKGLKQQILLHRLMPVVTAETKISLIQAQLSELCSHVCSYLVAYEDDDTLHDEWMVEIKTMIHDIHLPFALKKIIDDRPSLETTDPLFKLSDRKDEPRIKAYFLVNSNRKEPSAIEHYVGSRLSDQFPLITSAELDVFIDEIKGIDLNVSNELQRIVDLIGKEHAWDWRRARGITFLKGRLS